MKDRVKKLVARVISNREVAQKFYKMRLESTYLAKAAKPGQFIEVRCRPGVEPLLRRPFGIHKIADGGIEILYEVVGKGTQLVSAKKAGEGLDILGPLGNGFNIETAGRAILVAGGIGVAPLFALAGRLKSAHVIIGAKTKSHILCEKELRSLGCDVEIATEDGSKGFKGLATDLLSQLIRSTINERRPKGVPSEVERRASAKTPRKETIYACGPTGMLKAVAHIAAGHRIPCQVSLEERMACGVGVCLGCPVKVKPGNAYKMVCKDGPVFNAEEIVW